MRLNSERKLLLLFILTLLLAIAIGFYFYAKAEAQVTVGISATVKWSANTEPDLKGYRIYSGLIPCAGAGPLQPLAEVGKVTSYTVNIPDTAEAVSFRVSALDLSGNESALSDCVEKLFLTPLGQLRDRVVILEAAVGSLKAEREKMKAGLCALSGTSLTKDVLAERAALGGCP